MMLRINKDVIHHRVVKSRNVHMAHSPAITAVMIGRHMEPGGGSEESEREREREVGGTPGPSAELANKSEPGQLLSPQSTPLKIWNRDLGLARCQNPLHLKGLKLFLHLGHESLVLLLFCRHRCATVETPCVKEPRRTHGCVYLEGGTDACVVL